VQRVQEGDERRAPETVVLVGVAPRVVHLPLPEAEAPGYHNSSSSWRSDRSFKFDHGSMNAVHIYPPSSGSGSGSGSSSSSSSSSRPYTNRTQEEGTQEEEAGSLRQQRERENNKSKPADKTGLQPSVPSESQI